MICTVKDFVMFGFNFPADFVEKAFESQGTSMVNHLKEKFKEAYDRGGSRGAMSTFYAQLDSINQSLLESYVAKYYS